VLIQIVKQRRWSDGFNAAVIVGFCIGVGGLQAYADKLLLNVQMTWISLTQAAIVIGTAAVAAYNSFWKPQLGDFMKRLYGATSI
jgi:hypothetical protein